jgi:hypothetical protein
VQDFLAVLKRVSGKNIDNIAQTWLFTPTRPQRRQADVPTPIATNSLWAVTDEQGEATIKFSDPSTSN